jgi:L-aminopeptidase/D-esterase-like protein
LGIVQRRLTGEIGGGVPAGGNTTLTVLVTNISMSSFALRQLGREVHSSMSRAIQPFHTATDGDVFYTVSTGEVDGQEHLIQGGLGVLASELAWDAVLAAIPPDSEGG